MGRLRITDWLEMEQPRRPGGPQRGEKKKKSPLAAGKINNSVISDEFLPLIWFFLSLVLPFRSLFSPLLAAPPAPPRTLFPPFPSRFDLSHGGSGSLTGADGWAALVCPALPRRLPGHPQLPFIPGNPESPAGQPGAAPWVVLPSAAWGRCFRASPKAQPSLPTPGLLSLTLTAAKQSGVSSTASAASLSQARPHGCL